MAFSTAMVQPENKTSSEKPVGNDYTASLLSMIVLSVFAAHKGKRTFRKLKRQFMWMAFKLKLKSLISRRAEVSRNVLIYILLGILVLALLIVSPIAALVLAIIGLILILTGTI